MDCQESLDEISRTAKTILRNKNKEYIFFPMSEFNYTVFKTVSFGRKDEHIDQ